MMPLINTLQHHFQPNCDVILRKPQIHLTIAYLLQIVALDLL